MPDRVAANVHQSDGGRVSDDYAPEYDSPSAPENGPDRATSSEAGSLPDTKEGRGQGRSAAYKQVTTQDREPGEVDLSSFHDCPICGKMFFAFIDLYDHIARHRDEAKA